MNEQQRLVVQQALDAMGNITDFEGLEKARAALRQLLEAEPVQADEPVAWPLATEEEKDGGWTLSYKFLESLSDRIASHPAMETIEDVLLMAGSVAPPAQPAPVQPVAMTFDEAWASLSWQEWRMKSPKELFTELHRLTTAPAQPAAWVGLADAELYEIGGFKSTNGYVPTPFKRMMKEFEAKLREKNGY
jgi:hypothetical protein